MSKINSYREVLDLSCAVRNLRKGFITNFYPDSFRVDLWCKYGSLFYYLYPETVFFEQVERGFRHLFYISTSEQALKEALIDFLAGHETGSLVVDVLGNDSDLPVKRLFEENGFQEYSSLIRMTRINSLVGEEKVIPDVVFQAGIGDVQEILKLYDTYFDAYSEQIPLREELERWIASDHVLVYRADGHIVGFLIYDLTGVTLYLRYWFVHPEYRDQKIGAILFKEFMRRGENTRRQLFWVISSNENAIKRYVHYGFAIEKMFDYVLINTL